MTLEAQATALLSLLETMRIQAAAAVAAHRPAHLEAERHYASLCALNTADPTAITDVAIDAADRALTTTGRRMELLDGELAGIEKAVGELQDVEQHAKRAGL